MQKFKYLIETISDKELDKIGGGNLYLNKMGQEGWELVQLDYLATLDSYSFIFKQRIC